MRPHDNPFDILGVPAGADEETIRRAYRRLVREAHPDSVGGDVARFVEVREAYEALLDPQRRLQWLSAVRETVVRATVPKAAPPAPADLQGEVLVVTVDARFAEVGGAVTVSLVHAASEVRARVVLPPGLVHGEVHRAAVQLEGEETVVRLVRVRVVELRS